MSRGAEKQAAAVKVATARIATATQIEPSYSPGDASVQCMVPWVHATRANANSIGSAVYAGFTVVTNTHADTHS